MNKSKYLLLIITAAILCVITAGSALFSYITSGTVITREASDRYEVNFQTDAGTRLEAVVEPERPLPVSAGDTGTAERTVNINTATANELADILPGIGESKAAAIVEYRNLVGEFASINELIEVDGIGGALLKKISPYCVLSDSDAQ